ncbi:hypothetical protein [Anaerotignum sp.]|uniref:hypothetical protein n=1 Tax=Anaerotignum sp. TaxID=2039241 RepID=UPI003735548C
MYFRYANFDFVYMSYLVWDGQQEGGERIGKQIDDGKVLMAYREQAESAFCFALTCLAATISAGYESVFR